MMRFDSERATKTIGSREQVHVEPNQHSKKQVAGEVKEGKPRPQALVVAAHPRARTDQRVSRDSDEFESFLQES